MKPTRDQVLSTIVATIGDITRDWTLSAEVTEETRLVGELGFTSMDVIDLFAMLDLALRVKLPYEQFVVGPNGEYRTEMSVAQIAAFVDESYDKPRDGVHAV